MKLHVFVLSVVILLMLSGQVYASNQYSNAQKNTGYSDTDNDNLSPYVDYSFSRKAKVDIAFVLGSGPYDASTVASKYNSIIKPLLNEKNIDADFSVSTTPGALDAVLPSCTWRDDSTRYYIAVNNGTFPELADTQKYSSIMGNFAADEINFIGFGNYNNESIINNLISNNSGRGLFINIQDLNAAFIKLGNYIAGNVSVDLYFNVGQTSASALTTDIIKSKYESIVKPKLVANNISANATINNGSASKIGDFKIATGFYNRWPSGESSALVLKADGSVWTLKGQRVPGENGVGYLNNIVDVATNCFCNYAVGKDGSLYEWGTNYYYYGLGIGTDNSSISYTYPTKLKSLSNVVAVAAGGYYGGALALKSDGTVWHWGHVCMGYGLAAEDLVPTQIKGVGGDGYLNNIVKVAAGDRHCLALDKSGNLYSWGVNNNGTYTGNCGTGKNTSYIIYPTLIATNVRDISAKMNVSIFQKFDDSVWCFGCGNFRSSPNDYEPTYTPNCVYSSTPKIKQIVACPDSAYGLTESGNVVLLFYDHYQFAYGNYPYRSWGTSSCSDIIYTASYDSSYAFYVKPDGSVIEDTSHDSSHSYSDIGFNVKCDYSLSLDTAISSAPFTNSTADQYFVEISDNALDELNDNNVLNNISQILSNNSVNFIGIGAASNKTQLNTVISLNNGKGAFFDISNIDDAMNSLADYIVNNAMRPTSLISDYMLVTDEVEAPLVFYSDIESDPYDSKWTYDHNSKYFYSASGAAVAFDNSNGSFSLDKQVLSSPVTSFMDIDANGSKIGKVGGYKVSLQVQDKPKGEDSRFRDYRRYSRTVTKYINIHRKPIALYNVAVTASGVNYQVDLSDSNLSYDPDHTSRADKGIVKRIWGYGTIASSGVVTWKYIKTTDNKISYMLPKENRYLFSLQVQDMDGPYGYGAWSDPMIVEIPGKPVAQFTIAPNPLPVTSTAAVTDTSYVTVPGYAITQRSWNITKIGTASFNYADQAACKTNYLDSGIGEYLITLKVKDSGGNWSEPYTQSLSVLDNAAPVISAVPISASWTNKEVNVVLTASDTGGSGLKRIDYGWTQKPDEFPSYTSAGISNMPAVNKYSINTVQSEEGVWYLCARALDHSSNYSSDGKFNVYGAYLIDRTMPAANSTPDSGSDPTQLSIRINASDSGGSGIRSVAYQFTNSEARPGAGWSAVTVASPGVGSKSVPLTLNRQGTWYLHIQVTDYAGNTFYRQSGPYKLQNLQITGVRIEGYWNHWRGQTDIFGKRLTNEPHRFLSYEKVKITVDTVGSPDKIEVSFSPELESMSFTDIYGHTYRYEDKTGYTVQFPYSITVTGNQSVWEYILPLANSTKSWNDEAIRSPYRMWIKAYKDDTVVSYEVPGGIDITGNVYDLTYIQPLK